MLQYSTIEELEEQAGKLEDDEIYTIMVFSDNIWYFCLNTDYTFQGDKNIYDLIHPLEEMYMDCHQRSFEGSMGACVHWLSFRFKVVKFKESTILEYLDDNKIFKVRNISGMFLGVKLKQEFYHLMENGAEPKLVVYTKDV